MKMVVQANSLKIPLADESVQCVVTSPPYFGLREYGTARWVGGNDECDHVESELRTGQGLAALGEKYRGGGHKQGEITTLQYKRQCPKCGAIRKDAQIGIEQSPQEYVGNMIAVFRELWRVLRGDGVCWLNLGDTYSANRGYQVPDSKSKDVTNSGGMKSSDIGLAPKSLIGIPWRVALALQDDGWILRQEIIWEKPNAMPENVGDRCTKSHETIFLLSKNPRYYFDHVSIKEPSAGQKGRAADFKRKTKEADVPGQSAKQHRADQKSTKDTGLRNKRSVWSVPTKGFREAHFATFPPALVEPMILAGSKPGDVVLDPFSGAGTVGVVCKDHGRKFVGLDLNLDFCRMAAKRIRDHG